MSLRGVPCQIEVRWCPFCDAEATVCLTHTPQQVLEAALDEHLAEHVEEVLTCLPST